MLGIGSAWISSPVKLARWGGRSEQQEAFGWLVAQQAV